jgi:hypothetical protein
VTPASGQTTPTPVQTALSAAAGEQCASCGARMAADQRYCVECGERRGEPRFSIVDAVGSSARAQPAAPPRQRRSWMSPNSTLIAGVGTLLLAMGVGVLIGRSGDDSGSNSAANQPVRVVNVPSSGAATAATAAGAASAAKTAKGKGSGKSKSNVVQNAQTSGAEGQPVKELPPATVGVGDKGKGAGYKKGKFTGDFFGP